VTDARVSTWVAELVSLAEVPGPRLTQLVLEVLALPPVPDPTATIETLPATELYSTQVTLLGRINPQGQPTTGHFRWGTSPGALVGITAPVDMGAGTTDLDFATVITGLLGASTYYVQAVATQLGGDVFGAVLPFTTAGPQEFFDGDVAHPLTWITLTLKDGTKQAFAEVDLNDPPSYYDGYKRPRVEHFMTISRGLSDRDGQIEHMAFGAVFSDLATDRFDAPRPFRGMLTDPVNQYLTNRPLEVWFIDDPERRRKGVARLAALGFVNDYAPSPDLRFDLKGADWLKRKFSRKRRAQQGWQPLITIADFPTCPNETLNTPAAIVYGSLGLGGAEAVVGVVATINPQPSAPPANFALSLVAGGKTAGVTRYYQVTGIVGGQETQPTPILVGTTTNTNKTIHLSWDAVPGATAIQVYSSHRADFTQGAQLTLPGSATSYNDTTVLPNENTEWIKGTNWRNMFRINLAYYVWADLGGGLFSAPGLAYAMVTPTTYAGGDGAVSPLTRRNITISWTAAAGAVGYRIIRRRSYYSDWNATFDRQWDTVGPGLTVTDDNYTTTPVTMPRGDLITASAAGQVEAIYVGRGSYGTTPQPLSALLVARHACARVGNIYVPSTTADVDGETRDTFAKVEDAEFGVTWFAPDHPGWIYPTKYVEINGRWFTLIFTTIEPVPDRVFVDVDGVEAVGDGTGALLRSIVDQRLHFMVNFVAPDPPWAMGGYLTAASTVFPQQATIPLVDAASHATVKAQLAARLGGIDYEGATIIGAGGEFVTAVDALARFQISGDFEQTFNSQGQDSVSCEPITEATDLPTITDVLSVKDGTFNLVDQVQSGFFNILPFVHSRDYTGRENGGWYGKGEVRADDSIVNYDQEREAPTFELHACRGNTPVGRATVLDVMARKLARYQDPRRTGTLQMPFSGLNFEPGVAAAIHHIEGVGPAGWTGRAVRILRHEVDPSTGIVRLDFYDLTAVLENHAALLLKRPSGGDNFE